MEELKTSFLSEAKQASNSDIVNQMLIAQLILLRIDLEAIR